MTVTNEDVQAAVERVCRYIRCQDVLLEVLEETPIERVGVAGTLAVVAAVGHLLTDRALEAYGVAREARGLMRLPNPMPDASLIAALAEKIEGMRRGDPYDIG